MEDERRNGRKYSFNRHYTYSKHCLNILKLLFNIVIMISL